MTITGGREPGARLKELKDETVAVTDGPRLAIRHGDGPLRPFLLVHGLASNARLWDGVARRLVAAGHAVIAVDLRGHGRSESPDGGYDTDTCADDLATLIEDLRLTGGRAPIAVGQSWGGNVVMSLAARRAGVAAVCGVDGGWLRPGRRFASFDECWSVLAPPDWEGVTYRAVIQRITAAHPDWPAEGVRGVVAGLQELPGGGVRNRLSRDHHRSILLSMYRGDPRAWYPLINVPTLLCAAVPPADASEGGAESDDAARDDDTENVSHGRRDDRARRARGTREEVNEALTLLPDARVHWYIDADHDVHAQQPGRLARDLLALAAAAEPQAGPGAAA